jgi:hypothetical protein
MYRACVWKELMLLCTAMYEGIVRPWDLGVLNCRFRASATVGSGLVLPASPLKVLIT